MQEGYVCDKSINAADTHVVDFDCREGAETKVTVPVIDPNAQHVGQVEIYAAGLIPPDSKVWALGLTIINELLCITKTLIIAPKWGWEKTDGVIWTEYLGSGGNAPVSAEFQWLTAVRGRHVIVYVGDL